MKPEIINDIERLPEGLVQKAQSFTPGNLTMFDDNGNILDAGVVPGEGGDISSEAAGNVEGDAPTIDPAVQAAINVHANNKNNPHGVTAEQVGARPNTWTPTAQEVGALPLTGGTLSGDIYTKNGYGRITTSDTVFQTEIRNTIGNTNDRRLITLNNSASKSLSDAVALVDVVDGAVKGYNLYGEHNKPTANDVGTVNPNLLDNWYFLNPVNQRGFTTGPCYVANDFYPIDRWRRTGYSNGIITLTPEGVLIDSTATTSGSNRFRQTIKGVLPQNTYTFSVLVTEITGTLTMSLADSAFTALKTNTFSTPGVHTLTYTGNNLNTVYWGATIGSTVKVAAVKLEVGSVQTLAHQENGTWVLNEIPNYADELAKCIQYDSKKDDYIGYKAINQNILDNWYFLNPINQRGDTTLTTTANYKYFIDRWMLYYSGTVGEITADGVKITAPAGNYTSLLQRLENYEQLFNKTVTISVLFGNNELLKATGTITEVTATTVFATASNSTNTRVIRVAYSSANGVYAEFRVAAGETETIKAIKLEFGDTQTLAHQNQDGIWILNEVPDYGDQLAKCQRFQLKIGNKEGSTYVGPIATGFAYSATSIRCLIPTPVSMRTSPSISYLGGMALGDITAKGYAKSLAVTALTAIAHNNAILLIATVRGATANHTYALHADNSSGIMLEANL